MARTEVWKNDIVLGEAPKDMIGTMIVQQLAVKGFCVMSGGFPETILSKALEESVDLEDDFYKVNVLIQQALLGIEGSVKLADIPAARAEGEGDAPALEDEDGPHIGEHLRAVDDCITRIARMVQPHLSRLGCEATQRTAAVLHQGGCDEMEDSDDGFDLDGDGGGVKLNPTQVQHWMNQFVRHKVMVVVFLGPKEGTLELKLYDDEEAETFEVKTKPGSIVILRPDMMSHAHISAEKCTAISSFFLGDHIKKLVPEGGYHMIPPVREIDTWVFEELKNMKSSDEYGKVWGGDVPEAWKKVMNYMYTKGQMVGISGAHGESIASHNAEAQFMASLNGPDFMTEVPLQRWDHSEQYDPDPDGWRTSKSYCRHGGFMEGIEFFDNKFFTLSPNESKGMDPHHRHILEIGYQALHSAGYNKKGVMNAQNGIYVAQGNLEWSFVPGGSGSISGVSSFASGRLAFCLGMKGPALTLDVDQVGGMVCTYLAAECVQKKGTATPCANALGIGVHMLLANTWWPQHCAKGYLCAEGRCLTHNASANGFVRGDGNFALVVKRMSENVDGKMVSKEGQYWIGLIGSCTMNNNGGGASLMAPSGPAEQEVLAEGIRIAGLEPEHIDGAECNGIGNFVSDAVEVGSMLRTHRGEEHSKDQHFALMANKTSAGNQKEASGIAAILKICYGAQWGSMAPNIHLRQANPHLNAFDEPLAIPNECLEFPMTSTYNGVLSRGWGGTNVYAIILGGINKDRRKTPGAVGEKEPIQYWPGGGGELEDEQTPSRFYSIVGSWTKWEETEKMTEEGDMYTHVVTLGENRWEKFQILLDGNLTKALHPAKPNGTMDCSVNGPSNEDAKGNSWIIDGRPLMAPKIEDAERSEGDEGAIVEAGEQTMSWVEVQHPDLGLPGDQYLVKLGVAGKFRTVCWEKIQKSTSTEPRQVPPAKYYLTGSWNNWVLQEMKSDPETPGTFKLEIELTERGQGGSFQIIRNEDWDQVLYPSYHACGPGDESPILGPDGNGEDLTWYIDGKHGDNVLVEFQRTVDSDDDKRSVTWRRV